MVAIAIALIVCFALGYGVREWVSRRMRRENDVTLEQGSVEHRLAVRLEMLGQLGQKLLGNAVPRAPLGLPFGLPD
jgi:hypothetical protein